MSYRSRLYNHRNAQPPEGEKKKPFFSSKYGAGRADEKRKFFNAGPVPAMPDLKKPGAGVVPRVQRLATSGIDERMGTTEEREARNKGDKLRQQEAGGAGGGAQGIDTMPGDLQPRIQRDLAIAPTNPDAPEPVLTPQQIRNAVIFNNDRYGTDSIRLIQDIVGSTVTGVMNEETVRLIALYQVQNNLTPDGMAGPDTFGQLTDELDAENASQDTCLTSFFVGLVTPMQLHPGAAPGQVNIFGHFDIEIRFDPHCDCSRFEYRQFIGGDVTLNGVNINNQFTIPAPGGGVGGLPGLGNFVEDGNTSLPFNGRLGHRKIPANQQMLNQYADADGTINMDSGCVYTAFDEPGVTNAPGNTGDHYVFNIRFFGDILRDGTKIERKFWSVREDIIIP